MAGPIIIPKNPRRVVFDPLAETPTTNVQEDDLEQFNECLQKAFTVGWSPGEAKFMQKHLPPELRRADWAEED